MITECEIHKKVPITHTLAQAEKKSLNAKSVKSNWTPYIYTLLIGLERLFVKPLWKYGHFSISIFKKNRA